jgi:phosphatidylserine decarboxylase
VKRARPEEPVIVCKQGRSATINDIVRDELRLPKIIIGVFMSPLDVHYNRAPLDGILVSTKQYPARHVNRFMRSMHWRLMLRWPPFHANSPHIVENNRAVTRFCGTFRGRAVSCYVVQIGGGSVHGIDVYPQPGAAVAQGDIFGMIRVGSQVDLIVPDMPGLEVLVAPGEQVVAGETILIR